MLRTMGAYGKSNREKKMKALRIIILLAAFPLALLAQRTVNPNIPQGAIFYSSSWKGVPKASQAAYYRMLALDDKGRKMFYDYYISGQLRAEKHYVSIDRQDDKRTVLSGLCRTFHKSGRVESIMQYRNGKAHGRAVSFFPSGNVGMKLNYKDGVLDGTTYTYSEAGRLEYTTVWRNGSKVSEHQGGKDKYVDWETNTDPFCDEYRSDEALIMAQSAAIAENRTPAKNTGNQSIATAAPAKHPSLKNIERPSESVPKNVAAAQPSTELPSGFEHEITTSEEMAMNVKYPETEETATQTTAVLPETANGTGVSAAPRATNEFSFGYLYALLAGGDNRTNDLSFFDSVGASYGLTLAQTIQGYGAQKELAYNYNMHYDGATDDDVVTGPNPRQMGFFGVGLDRRFTVQRINLYTWSEDEMIHIAEDAVSKGYKVLGGGDFHQMNGNFVLEHPEHNKPGDPYTVVLSFTHLNGVYAGLYHVRMEIK